MSETQLISSSQSHKHQNIMVVGILFTAFLVLSNLTAFKLALIGSTTITAGIIFFPVTYIFDDVLTEVYGFKISRRVIWTALAANVLIMLGIQLTVYLTPSPIWPHQHSYEIVFHAVPRVFIGSIVGYLIGEFLNSMILAKLKIFTSGRHLWFRAITSTAIAVAFDTVLFTHIAFLHSIAYIEIWKISYVEYVFKVGYEILLIPVTYKVANYLKRKDHVDHYDYDTKFNPFSLAVD